MRRLFGVVLIGLCLFLAGCTREVPTETGPDQAVTVAPIDTEPASRYFDVRIFDVPHVPWQEHSVAVTDGRLVGFFQDANTPFQAYSIDLYGEDLQLGQILPLENARIIGPRLAKDGTLLFLAETLTPVPEHGPTLLIQLDNRGNVLGQSEIEHPFTWIGDIETDGAGNLYLLGQQDQRHLALAYDSDTLTPIGETTHDGWDHALVRVGNYVYLGGHGQAVQRIEVGQTVTLGERVTLDLHARTWSGLDGRVYFFHDRSLYSQAPEEGGARRELDWMDVDIPHTLVQSLLVLEDGTVLLSLQGHQMAVLTPLAEPPAAPQQQQLLTLATVGHSAALEEIVAQFNRAHTDYRIVIDDYARYDTAEDPVGGFRRLEADLLAGTGPDIVDMSGLNPALLGDARALRDLTTWIDTDAFVPEVLAALDQDGALYMLPATFYLMALAGGPAHQYLQGWDIEGFLDYAESLPPGAAPISGVSGMWLAQLLATHNLEALTAQDDLPEWVPRLAEYAAVSDTAGQDYSEPPDGHRPLEFIQINDLAIRQLYEARFGELTLVNFPGGAETAFGFGRSFAIPQESAAPEAAWRFIRQFAIEQADNLWDVWGISVLQAGLETKLESALLAPPQTWGIGELVVEIAPTEEDVEWLLELIATTTTFSRLDGITWAQLEAQILGVWPDGYH